MIFMICVLVFDIVIYKLLHCNNQWVEFNTVKMINHTVVKIVAFYYVCNNKSFFNKSP